ncbi:MAG: hypothetical protein EAZ91_20975 [Cytophagales bacterium]|nr:MAG: hypothetical protein EAZ91_20975 [Cytophagales bacterium]
MFSFSTRERQLQFLYLLGGVLALWGVASWLMTRNHDSALRNTDYLVEQISRQRQLLADQQNNFVLLDSTYRAIVAYQPQVNAVFVEVDIEGQLADIRALSGRTTDGIRFRSYAQIADFYKMVYTDKKVLWSKQANIQLFRKQADECEVGYQRAMGPIVVNNAPSSTTAGSPDRRTAGPSNQ